MFGSLQKSCTGEDSGEEKELMDSYNGGAARLVLLGYHE